MTHCAKKSQASLNWAVIDLIVPKKREPILPVMGLPVFLNVGFFSLLEMMSSLNDSHWTGMHHPHGTFLTMKGATQDFFFHDAVF